jgi:hypothetical protein
MLFYLAMALSVIMLFYGWLSGCYGDIFAGRQLNYKSPKGAVLIALTLVTLTLFAIAPFLSSDESDSKSAQQKVIEKIKSQYPEEVDNGIPDPEKHGRYWLSQALKRYVATSGGGVFFPTGGSDSYDSLAKAIASQNDLRWFTSEKLYSTAKEYFRTNHTLRSEHTCYAYNEGLAAFDPDDLIVMYDKTEPIPSYGRWVKTIKDWDYRSETYLSAADFAQQQDRTAKFLEARAKFAARNARLQPSLELTLIEKSASKEGRIVNAILENHSDKPLTLEIGKIFLSCGTPPIYLFNDNSKPRRITVAPGKNFEWKAGTFNLTPDAQGYGISLTVGDAGYSSHFPAFKHGVPFVATLHVREFDADGNLKADAVAPKAKYVWQDSPSSKN